MTEEDNTALSEQVKSLQAEVARLTAALSDARNRMDRARNILTKGNPTPSCNWGMLDTSKSI